MSNKCAICGKSVYMAEERKALKKIYHITCFKCGGVNSDGCGKKLSLDGYTAHDDEPYCRPCYSKLFGPSGFRGGSTSLHLESAAAKEEEEDA